MGDLERGRSSQAKLDALCRLGQALVLLRDEQQIARAVLEIAEEVLDLGDCDVLLVDEARGELYLAARRGEMREVEGLRLPLDGERGITVAAARGGQVVYVPDVRSDPRYVDTGFDAVSELAVPVQVEGRVIGVINVESREPDAFTATDAQLLATLASQAALALENARLYTRERRRVEELAAVNEVARRISATLDLQETLEAIVDAAAGLVPCALAEISLWDEERRVLTLQALRCTPERAFPIGATFPPGEGYTGWVVRQKKPLLVPDVDAWAEVRPDILPGELPFKAYVGLPLLAGEELIGTLVLVHDQAGVFDQQDLSLLKALAGQAAVAIHNARLFGELARRHRELAALYTVAAAVNRPGNLDQVLDEGLRQVLAVTGFAMGAIALRGPHGDSLVLRSHQGMSPGIVDWLGGQLARKSGEPWPEGEEILVDEIPAGLPGPSSGLGEQGIRLWIEVPLFAEGRLVGVLSVATREAHALTAEERSLLKAVGHQLGTAIENARLRGQALEAERLAAVGRVAGTVAHDLRSPLGGIIRSAEFLARPELSDATRRKLSQAVVAMARRLINTAQEILDFSRGGRMSLNLVPCLLSEFLEGVIEVLRVDFSDRGIEVVMDWGYAGQVRIDADRMAQVVYNVAANARDAMPQGGQLRVATQRVDGEVEIRFTDTGPGVPPELAERIFEPFASYGKREGAGLGLSIARRIVEEHGGRIWVESSPGGGATFVVSLPAGG